MTRIGKLIHCWSNSNKLSGGPLRSIVSLRMPPFYLTQALPSTGRNGRKGNDNLGFSYMIITAQMLLWLSWCSTAHFQPHSMVAPARLSTALLWTEHVGGLGVRNRVWLRCCRGNRDIADFQPSQPLTVWGAKMTVDAGKLTKILQTCMQSST